MARIVMKFGGTSMAGIERIRHVAALVKREADRGNQVAVVVSAMAGETDRLVQLCKEAAPLYDPRIFPSAKNLSAITTAEHWKIAL